MRALGFCMSVEFARWRARKFMAAGLRTAALDSSSARDERADQIRRLRAGELQILFAVDLFKEMLDISAIDTVLLLRPTESAVVFLQQLGRGLRLSPETGKSCLTVLDFIGQQHRRFRFDQRFRALLGGSRRQLESQLDQGFPFLPPGCRLVLDRVSQQAVLASLRASLPTRRPALLGELRALASEGVISPPQAWPPGSRRWGWSRPSSMAYAAPASPPCGATSAGSQVLPIRRRSGSRAPSPPACSTPTIPITCAGLLQSSSPPAPPIPPALASASGANG
jgi:hypothetical protein